MKKLILLILLLSAGLASGAGDGFTRLNQHQTNNTTWTPVSSTCWVPTLIFNVSGAGTSWIITIKNKESTPKVLWSGTATLGTVTVLAMDFGLEMTGGIDVTFSGTAGTADFYLVYK